MERYLSINMEIKKKVIKLCCVQILNYCKFKEKEFNLQHVLIVNQIFDFFLVV
jgi:hypothetical protein